MNKKDETNKCEICGKAGSSIVMLGKKGSNHADFYWICEHCEKAVRWAFARIEDAKKEECGNNREEQK